MGYVENRTTRGRVMGERVADLLRLAKVIH